MNLSAKYNYPGPMKQGLLASAVCLIAMLFVGTAFAASHASQRGNDEVRDAWLDGKLETAYLLNRHLNPFTIDTDIKDGVAVISGKVESEVDKDLAEEIARSIDGITQVKNELKVDAKGARNKSGDANQRSFGEVVDDATTTAAIKSKLLANDNTSGLKVNVDTRKSVVTLSGSVESAEEKALVEQIAENQANVARVESKLTVRSQG